MASSDPNGAVALPITVALPLTAADYLLYLRCPRSLHFRLTGREPRDENPFPVASDRAAVRAIAQNTIPGGETAERWIAGPFVASPDVYLPIKPEGHATVLVREATGLKRAYLRECAFIRYCAERLGYPVDRQYVHHVRKTYQREGDIDPEGLFVASDVTRRVNSIYQDQLLEIERLAAEIGEDSSLSVYADQPCARPHACPVCSLDAPPRVDDHVSTLYRGSDLARELLNEGYTTILEVPNSRLKNTRHHIQKTSLVSREPQTNITLLSDFLSSLRFPVRYIDFEAATWPIPPFDGIRPWEHVPYLYSVHCHGSRRERPTHSWFLSRPGCDDRALMLEQLLTDLGTAGSIVVYGAAFEVSVLRRLATQFPDHADEIASVIERIVDLLSPFNDFAYYHYAQRGKVSLKSVLPAIADHDYSGMTISGGLEANLAYRYLVEHPDTSDRQRILEDLIEYCGMDTLAMVRIVEQLRRMTVRGAG